MQTKGQLTKDIQFQLRDLTARLHRLNDAVGGHVDLLPGDIEVLDQIARKGPLAPRDIISAAGIHPATLTGMLDRLERGGWVTRQPDPLDRRKVRIEARYERAGELLRLYGPMNSSVSKLCSSHTVSELSLIRDFLETLSSAAATAAQEAREK